VKIPFVAAATLVGAVACGSEPTASTVSVNLTLARMAPASAAVGLALDIEAAGARINLASIDAFDVEIDRVEIHTPGSGWTGLDLDPPVALDLTALPNEGAGDPIELGTIDGLESGECRVRLFLSTASIIFNEDITAGGSQFLAGTEYTAELKFPSGDQTGLKAEGACTVPDGGGDVTLLFDESATVGTITATGNGRIVVSPVIHVHTDGAGGV